MHGVVEKQTKMSKVELDKDVFFRRVKRLYASWKVMRNKFKMAFICMQNHSFMYILPGVAKFPYKITTHGLIN